MRACFRSCADWPSSSGSRGNIIFVVSLAWLISAIAIGPLDRLFDTRRLVVAVGATLMAFWFALLAVADGSSLTFAVGVMIALGLCSGLSSPIFAHARALFSDRYVGRLVTAINLFIWGAVHNPNPKSGESISWSGSCRDGFAHGPGTIAWFLDDKPNGRFEGALVKGRIEGEGTADYPSGNHYTGDFLRGQPNGSGIFYFADGRRFEGDWRDGRPEGAGVIVLNRWRGDAADMARGSSGQVAGRGQSFPEPQNQIRRDQAEDDTGRVRQGVGHAGIPASPGALRDLDEYPDPDRRASGENAAVPIGKTQSRAACDDAVSHQMQRLVGAVGRIELRLRNQRQDYHERHGREIGQDKQPMGQMDHCRQPSR
mgnify:CR=1 FL=1